MKVFISYSHENEAWKDRVVSQLEVLRRQRVIDIWVDREIEVGGKWRPEIEEAINTCDVAVLLISHHFLSSRFIIDEEVPRLLERWRKNLVRIFPVIIIPCAWKAVEWLESLQLFPRDGKPLMDFDELGIEKKLALLTDMIHQLVGDAPPGNGENISAVNPALIDPASLVIPGGAMDPETPFYIERPADKETIDVAFRHRGMATVRGPRQTGKSSLIARVNDRARRATPPHRTALIDYQLFQPPDFQTLDTIWKAIIVRISENLHLNDKWGPDAWKRQSTRERNITRFLVRGVFSEDSSPLLICIDEVDRAFQIPVSGAFFSALRSFYNRGATDPAWKPPASYLKTPTEKSSPSVDYTRTTLNNIWNRL